MFQYVNQSAALLLLVPALLAAGESQKKSSREAKTPEEAITLFVEAAQAGDVETLLAQLADPLRRTMQKLVDVEEATQLFEESLDAKFGKSKDAQHKARTFAEVLKTLKRIQILQRKKLDHDLVSLKIWEHKLTSDGKERIVETWVQAIQVNDSWKLYYPRLLGAGPQEKSNKKGPDGESVAVYVEEQLDDLTSFKEEQPQISRAFQLIAQSYRKLAAKVKAGSYESREEAIKAASKMFTMTEPQPD